MSNKSLKKFLTTASALAMIATGAHEAAAAGLRTVRDRDAHNPALTATVNDFTILGVGGGNTTVQNNDIVQFSATHGQHIGFNTANFSLVFDLVNVVDARSLILSDVVSSSFKIQNTGGGGGNLTIYAADGAQIWTITNANNLRNVGVITIDANDVNTNFTFNPGAGNATDHTGVTYQSTGGSNGTLTVASGTVTLGTFDAGANTMFTILNINEGAVANTSGTISLAEAGDVAGTGTINLEGTLNVRRTHNVGAIVEGVAGKNSVLNFAGASNVVGTVGVTHSVTAINATLAAGEVLNFLGHVKAGAGGVNITSVATGNTIFGGTLTTENMSNVDLSAAAGANTIKGIAAIDGVLKTGAGKLTANSAVTVANTTKGGANPATAAIDIGAGGADFNAALTVTLGDLDLSRATASTKMVGVLTMTNGNIKLGAGGLRAEGGINVIAVGKTINLNNGTLTLVGNESITKNSNIIAAVTGNVNTNILQLGDAANSYGGVIKSNIGTAESPLSKIMVKNVGNVKSTIGGADSLTTDVYTDNSTIYATGLGTEGLTVNSKANSITYRGTIDGNVLGVGTLILTNGGGGNTNLITVTGAIGNTNKLLNVTTAGNTLFQSAVKATTVTVNAGGLTTFNDVVTGEVNLAENGSKVTFLNNVTGPISSGHDTTTVTFGDGTERDINVQGDGAAVIGIGSAGHKIGSVILSLGGGTLTLNTGSLTVGTIQFKSDDTLTIAPATAAATSVADVITTTAGNGTGTLNINTNNATFTTAAQIGAVGASLKELHFGGAATFTVSDDVYANSLTGANLSVVINKVMTAGTIKAYGTAQNPLAKFTVNANKSLTVDSIYATASDLTDNATTITVNNNGTLKLGTPANVGGNIVLTDNATLGNLGSAAKAATKLTMNRTNGGIVTIDGNALYVTDIEQHGNTLKLTQDTTINGANSYVIDAPSTVDTNGKDLTLTNIALKVNANTTLIAGVTSQNSLMIVSDDPEINNGVLTLVYKPNDKEDIVGNSINVFSDAVGAIKVAKVAAGGNVVAAAFKIDTSADRYTKLTYIDAAGVATSGGVIEGKLKVTRLTDTLPNASSQEREIDNMISQANSSEGRKIKLAFGAMDDTQIKEAIDGIKNHVSEATAPMVVGAASQATTSAISNMSDMTRQRSFTTSDMGAGTSAGDSSERLGLWAQVMGTTAKQKQRKELSGFDVKGGGLLVGLDTMVNDNATLGMIASCIKNDVKFKDTNTGDKADANSFIFGVYGKYDIGTTDFFVQGNLNVAQTGVNSKGKKLVGVGRYETAKAKYDILGVGAEVAAGYKYSFDTTYIAPTIGLRYNYFGDSSYTGTGLTVGNQSVKTKSTKQVSGLLGLRVGGNVDMDGTNIKPEAHMNLSYAFNSPSTKTTYKVSGFDKNLTYTGPKAARFAVNGGFSLMAEAEGFEYGAGYDANISDKYLGHTGTLKVRVKL